MKTYQSATPKLHDVLIDNHYKYVRNAARGRHEPRCGRIDQLGCYGTGFKSLCSDSSVPFVYSVGPLPSLEDGAGKPLEDDVKSFEEVQVKEIAYALEQSGHRFLVVAIRVITRRIHEWRCQKDSWSALKGSGRWLCWLTSAVLEGLWFGLPIAAWPMYTEKQLNAFEMVVELGLAVEIKMDYKKKLFNPKANIDSG
ncbi:hypothetical protein OSB04_028529 [Centaurea solstitialis]|uniref:Uncharacterized protein n=1 Tax=Centaurea solstitialis TaxID=347529 RepID=A0AA38SGN4_9ASTR|nr:hypothetical protein OSB04_028529 [Centaurea solstitialis]